MIEVARLKIYGKLARRDTQHGEGERHLFHYFSFTMRRDVVFEAIATNWLKWLQQQPPRRPRPTVSSERGQLLS